MEQIPLSQGQYVLVDDTDYPILADFKWCYRAERDGKQGYAVRHGKVEGRDRLIYLHRSLMHSQPGQEVIFLNHDRLDCRRANLRVVTKQEARQHHRVRRDSKTGVKGVRYNREGGTWTAHMYRNGQCYTIGSYYYRREEAIAAYDQAMLQENPELHQAPMPIERLSNPAPVQQATAEAG